MSRRWKQLIALCLTGGLLLGSVAGLSPLLHVWLEHGGQGPAHVHLRGAAPGSAAGAEVMRTTPAAPGKPIHVAVRSPAAQAHTFQLPTVALAKFWQLFLHHLGHDASPDTNAPAGAHHHDSLAQTLAGGLIVPALPGLPWFANEVSVRSTVATWDGFRLTSVFHLLRPERGPPGFAG